MILGVQLKGMLFQTLIGTVTEDVFLLEKFFLFFSQFSGDIDNQAGTTFKINSQLLEISYTTQVMV